VLAEFKSHLDGLEVAVFDGVFGNPTCAQVMAGAAAFKAHGADCIIGFGGGAALDVAKVVGVMAVHDGDVLEYVWDHPQVRPIARAARTSWPCPPPAAPAPRSAARRWSARTTRTSSAPCSAPKILAKAVFADPELTLALPAARHRRHRHGRADAQHRELPLAGLPPAVRRHRARRACASARGRWSPR
jgi:alcohol dehydrogenase class IV